MRTITRSAAAISLIALLAATGATTASAAEYPGPIGVVHPNLDPEAAQAWADQTAWSTEAETCLDPGTAFTTTPGYDVSAPAIGLYVESTGATAQINVLGSACAQSFGITELRYSWPDDMGRLTADGRGIAFDTVPPAHYECDDPEHVAEWGCPAYGGGGRAEGLLPDGSWTPISVRWWAPGVLPGGGVTPPVVDPEPVEPPVTPPVVAPVEPPVTVDPTVPEPVSPAPEVPTEPTPVVPQPVKPGSPPVEDAPAPAPAEPNGPAEAERAAPVTRIDTGLPAEGDQPRLIGGVAVLGGAALLTVMAASRRLIGGSL
ncbi:hypothetical protein [Sanguibacter sp. Leaf3]|uniref:hypothetical protein n=1 Tax=Sanguibacter sp. Leaf3 TaxID=1736209 RepID=UPI0006FA4BCE|nr:hypothetical protein [Sanguibacter sp. Leaf3]KQT98389.1 hypothetical protein ASG53_12065 [Sanguibacter sp. Leaf3]